MWKPTISSDEIYHSCLAHSAKGSTWKDHKYVKKVNGRYIYSSDKAKGVEQIRGEAMNEKIAKENASNKINQANEAIKKAQKKASEHPIHTTRVKDDRWGTRTYAAQNNRQEYKFRSNSPGSSKSTYSFDTRGDNATHIKSDIEKADFFAASASKNATKNRVEAAKRYKEYSAYNYKDKPYDDVDTEGASERKKNAKKNYEKWSTIEKSASIRQKQEEAYNKKKSSKSTGTNSKKKTSKTKKLSEKNKKKK